MDCEFENGAAGTECRRCGYKLKRSTHRPPIRNCRHGFGDRVAQLLNRIGITEARWLALKGIVVEEPTCGCQRRIEKLNAWGEKLARWRERWLRFAENFKRRPS